jgi:putative protease
MAIELLAPAKNAERGILAIRCGADAVYVGGPQFGARRGAANEMSELERLALEAHRWRARVYVTLNTIIFEDELEAARKAAWAAFEIGADALIVQDMAFLEMDLPNIPLYASTQAACDSPEKVSFLASSGFSRAILARELTLAQIKAVRDASDIELEAFVYGALCVSESGRCWLSQAICGRGGNRGECAQPCRRDWSLLDANGRTLIKDAPLLSIKDLELSDELESLIDAGVHSFKIEGRLKDSDYIKNVVSHTRRKIDALLTARPDLSRASSGQVKHGFVPDPAKTFQRGYTRYQLDGRRRSITTGQASGHLGESIGFARSIADDRVLLDREHNLNPGDGLAFSGPSGRIIGTLLNAVEGRQITVQNPYGLRQGQEIFRNFDHAWHKALRRADVDRRIYVSAWLDFPDGGARLRLCDEDGCRAEIHINEICPPPEKREVFAQTAREALSRLGDTPFSLGECHIEAAGFLPLSRLNAMRRQAVEQLIQNRLSSHPRQSRKNAKVAPQAVIEKNLGYEWNVSNSLARAFYERHGAKHIEQAYELGVSHVRPLLMTTRLCLKYELGWCHIHKNEKPLKNITDPETDIYLKNGPITLKCQFDCNRCVMRLYLWTADVALLHV